MKELLSPATILSSLSARSLAFSAAPFLLSLIVACTHSSSTNTPTPAATTQQDGGVLDGGGGDFMYNTREEVVQTLNDVWAQLTISRPDNPILVTYLNLTEAAPTIEDRYVLKMLVQILSIKPNQRPFVRDDTPDRFEELELSKYLKDKHLKLLEKDRCEGPDDHKYMASVTKLDRGGEICVSLGALENSPTGSLKFDLLALMVHEIAHLNGYREDDARRIQRYFLVHMPQILRLDGKQTMIWVSTGVWKKARGWRNLTVYPNFTESYLRTAEMLAENIQDLTLQLPIPYWGDNILIAKPELYEETRLKCLAVAGSIGDFVEGLGFGLKNKKTLKVTPEDLARIRKISLSMLDLTGRVNNYLYGDGPIPDQVKETQTELDKDRQVLLRATDPKVLADPKQREDVAEDLEAL
jgi:hypothetical protein